LGEVVCDHFNENTRSDDLKFPRQDQGEISHQIIQDSKKIPGPGTGDNQVRWGVITTMKTPRVMI
jgi:hypothetical protein